MRYEPGADVTSFLWQNLQQNTIQQQLNATHDMYQRRASPPPNHPPRKSTKMWLYNGAVKFLLNEKYLMAYVPPISREEIKTSNLFDDSLTNLLELRKVKLWARYMLSDGVIRYGTIQKHPLYNRCPGWLMDVLWHQRRNGNLTLVWCTDIRGVEKYLGALCSTINLHHLFQRLERKDRNNYTAILLQMTILSTESLNPINRQGIKFPQSAVTGCTFENIKRSLSSMKKRKNKKKEYRDGASAPFTRLMLVLPNRIGTNYFDLKLKK